MKLMHVLVAAKLVAVVSLVTLCAVACGAGPPGAGAASGIDLICYADQPVILEGGSTAVSALAIASDGGGAINGVRFDWVVPAGDGHIKGKTATAQWNLSSVSVPADQSREAAATVKAKAPGGGTASCTVVVEVRKSTVQQKARGLELISGKHYLLPRQNEAPLFGMYSYLLFNGPPRDGEEKARYLKTLESCLRQLQDVDDYLSLNVRPGKLNVTYIPVREQPAPGKSDAELAENVLKVYDYARAQILLNQLDKDHQHGPYLVSVLTPLSSLFQQPAEAGTSPRLWEDFTGVTPELAWDWMKLFTYLAAQQRSWSDESLQRFALNLRNVVAVGAKVTPATAAALRQAIRYVR